MKIRFVGGSRDGQTHEVGPAPRRVLVAVSREPTSGVVEDFLTIRHSPWAPRPVRLAREEYRLERRASGEYEYVLEAVVEP